MLSALLSRAWWSAAGQRALRTVLVALVPFVPVLLDPTTSGLIAAGSTVALSAVLSLATSLWRLPEVDGLPRPWWAAALDRAARTFGQVLVSSLPAAGLLTDVAWSTVLTQAGVAALSSVILAAIAVLPETVPIAAPVDADGVPQITTLRVTAVDPLPDVDELVRRQLPPYTD
jgi:hypothetical protein